MINLAWNAEEPDRDAELTGSPRPLLVTWRFLRNALRRGSRIWVGLAVLGGFLGVTAALLFPPSSTSKVTLLMAHPPTVDAPTAIATDVSLVTTREVAARTVQALGLGMTPDAFQSTVHAVPVTNQVLTITVAAPDGQAAVARANALVTQYLAFRADQMRSQVSGITSVNTSAIQAKQARVDELTRQYNQVVQHGGQGQGTAIRLLSQRDDLNAQIATLQQAIEDARLQTDEAIASTHVIDAADPVRPSARKAMVLDVAAGLIVGAALGAGFVLLRALTSDRLRRRHEVALALGVPVRFSVSSDGPPGHERAGLRARLRPRLTRRRSSVRVARARERDLQALVHGLESAVAPRPLPQGSKAPAASRAATRKRAGPADGVALAAIGNAPFAAAVIDALARRLCRLGRSVFLVDLSVSGALTHRLSPMGGQSGRVDPTEHAQVLVADAGAAPTPSVFRPAGVAELARGPRGAARGAVTDLPVGDPSRAAWDAADVVLALVEVDPGIEVAHLGSWVDQVVPLVTAGRSSAELLETTAELIRAAGLTLPFAMLVGSEDSDESLGLVETAEPASLAASGQA